ncbi:MAG: serine/threonine protein kinase [Gemmataceae bacterium]|nr:serine/threonine protein kinase [Gemmataceae bacterium]
MVSNRCNLCGNALVAGASCSTCTTGPAETVAVVADATSTEPSDQSPTVHATDLLGENASRAADLPGYELLGVLGQGAMGVVHRARQIALDRFVAIKVVRGNTLNNTLRARFLQEARSSAKLKHPNIVIVYDLGQLGEQLFLVMELLEGETLAQHIARMGKIDECRTWMLVRQAVAGLVHAEQVGIVHRDIKPENLFITSSGDGGEPFLKIMDFGLALLNQRAEGEALTNAGEILGTPIYMAPEQFASSRVDARADIYSLGVTALHMLTGQTPYGNTSIWKIVAKKRVPLPIPTHLSAAGQALLHRMTAPQLGDRIATHADLLIAIDRLLDARPSEPASTIPEPPKLARRRWRWFVFAGLIVLALAGATAVYLRQGHVSEEWIADGSISLFDGKNLAGWRFIRGTWKPDKDAEGGTVLSGQGIIARPLPDFANYRLLLGVDSSQCKLVEVQFGIVGDGASASRLMLRIASDSIAIGKQVGEDGSFALIASIPAPPGPDREQETPYREVRIERIAGRWKAYYHGKLVGEARAPTNERPEFRLQANGGAARFETIEVIEMKG